jgi:hypothetical protein
MIGPETISEKLEVDGIAAACKCLRSRDSRAAEEVADIGRSDWQILNCPQATNGFSLRVKATNVYPTWEATSYFPES